MAIVDDQDPVEQLATQGSDHRSLCSRLPQAKDMVLADADRSWARIGCRAAAETGGCPAAAREPRTEGEVSGGVSLAWSLGPNLY